MKVRPAALIVRYNQVLLLRYQYGGQDVFAFPGGNPDRGETMSDTLVRELREELGVSITVGLIVLVGEVSLEQLKDDVLHVIFQGTLAEADTPVLNPEETSALEVVWKPVAELQSLSLYPNVGQTIQQWLADGQRLNYVGRINQAYFG